ncbi:MaoC family dehydratase [Actinomadura sp. WMMB 499]|uniref:MaoC family dehydratase n=1 Tax=Actinomadura sp. WMMB 499 TaxID=1219491 RepID=UPI001245992D|nr:MaoC family dehydratase [Actinomadura sp. WMMB 499]QFG26178.1 MaoC family dehydratase [Actinomadura sp. WMMB 499]
MTAMEPVRFVVTQEMLDDFGRVGGGSGAIHTDPEVARPLFGGTIAQAMFLLDPVVQRMVGLSGLDLWYARGRLEAKFVGNTLAGETVTIVGTVTGTRTDGGVTMADCRFTATAGDDERTVLVAEATGPFVGPAPTAAQEDA